MSTDDHSTPTGIDLDFTWGLLETGVSVAVTDAEAALSDASDGDRDALLSAIDAAAAVKDEVYAPLSALVQLDNQRLSPAQWEDAREHLSRLRQAREKLAELTAEQ